MVGAPERSKILFLLVMVIILYKKGPIPILLDGTITNHPGLDARASPLELYRTSSDILAQHAEFKLLKLNATWGFDWTS